MKYLTVVLAMFSVTPVAFAMNVKVKIQSQTHDKFCAKSAGLALGNKLDFWGEPAVTSLLVKEIETSKVYEVTTSTEAEDQLVYQIRVSDMRSEDGTCTATHFRTPVNANWESL